MDLLKVFLGFFLSGFVGAFFLWIIIDKITWSYFCKKQNTAAKPPGILTLPLGILERLGYTGALLIGAPEWIAIWLGLKVAVHWDRWKGTERATYNIFLIGNLLSISFAIAGAWIAMGKNPFE